MKRVPFAAPRVHAPSVGRFVLWGPLVGGAPYVWTLIAIPFAYLVGLVPALIAGLAYGAWRRTQGPRRPGARWRFAVGTISGAFAAALAGLLAGLLNGSSNGLFVAGVVAAHGIPAAAILALAERRPTPPAIPAPATPVGRETAPATA